MSTTVSAASSTPSTPRTRFTALGAQVGGHPGVLASDDGAVIVKPALPAEAAFYARIAEGDSALANLRPFVPSFYGTLRLAGEAPGGDIEAGLHPAPADIPAADKECIVLENIASSFSKPNILDLKLGTVLYADDATPEKRERMLKTARQTTSLETGLRITGFQVYDYTTRAPSIVAKAYGKSLRVDQLPDAMRRIFPLNTSNAANTSAAQSRPLSGNTSGELDTSVSEAVTQEHREEPEGSGLPLPLLLAVLRGIISRTRSLRAVLAETELRLVGSSLLIVYEADWQRAAQLLAAPAVHSGEEDANMEAAALDAEGTLVTEEDGYAEDDEGNEADSDEDADSNEDEDGPPYAVALIDFAHTKVVPGEGPDERVLVGVDTAIRLFERRLAEVVKSGLHNGMK